MASRSRAERTVLLTGFEPFGLDQGGDPVNPSWLIAQALHGQRVDGARVESVQLPTVFGAANQRLAEAFARTKPQLVLCLGLAANRAEISVERVAINVDDARIPDNAGASPVDEPVIAGAPAAHFSTLPIKAIVAALQQAGLPAVVSQTAGTFVCNHVFYGLMHALHSRSDLHGVRGGFMHVPWLPGQGTPSLALQPLVQGTRAALVCAIAHITQGRDDDRSAGGALH